MKQGIRRRVVRFGECPVFKYLWETDNYGRMQSQKHWEWGKEVCRERSIHGNLYKSGKQWVFVSFE